VFISPSVRDALKAIVRTPTQPYRSVIRARIVLLASRGLDSTEIARRLSCDVDTVRLWRRRFADDPRLAALDDHPRSGRPARVPTEIRCALLKLACTPPKDARTTWSRDALRSALAEETDWTLSTTEIGRILHNGQLRPHRYRLWLHSPDPEFAPKVRRICELYLRPPPGATVICVDEKTQIQALRRRFPGRFPAPRLPGRYEFEYRRHGVVALIAAFDVRTGRVFAQCRRRRKAVDLIAFMEALAVKYPSGPVYVVWDNLDIHREGPDKRWTAFNRRHGQRFHFVYTPKHASWMNQVEIWFSILQRRVIRFGNFIDRADLRKKLERFVVQWNRSEAHPFRWTFRGEFAQDFVQPHVEAPRRAA
jgi:transposase